MVHLIAVSVFFSICIALVNIFLLYFQLFLLLRDSSSSLVKSLVMAEKLIVLNLRINCLKHLFTKLRDKNTSSIEFKRYANRIMSIISEEGLSYISPSPLTVTTPTDCKVDGEHIDLSSIVVISIIRAGDSMLDVFMSLVPEATVGKILIQRDEATAQPILFYSKLPSLLNKNVIVLDPMLATGGSAIVAIRVLIENGADPNRISFFNVVSCPEGIANFQSEFPQITIVTAEIDAGLNDKVGIRLAFHYFYVC